MSTHASSRNRLAMARSRGAVTGPLLVVLGAWGALIPFFGHSFGYGFTPGNTWAWTAARGWLEVLPGAATFAGGLILTTTGNRLNALVASWVAAVAGAWFVLGIVVAPWWSAGNIGTPSGDAHHAVWERLGMFDGLGVVIIALSAIAIGRATVVGARDIAAGEARRSAAYDRQVAAEQEAAAARETGSQQDPIDLDRPAPTTAPATTSATTDRTDTTGATDQPVAPAQPARNVRSAR